MTVPEVDHRRRVEAARRARLERLQDPEGWLSLVGLEWLHAGENVAGADPRSDVVLRAGDAPARAGTLLVSGDEVRFVAAPGVEVTRDGERIAEAVLRDDVAGPPTKLAIGLLRFHLIRRGDRLALRVRDRSAAALAGFRGLDYFPIDPSWRVVGHLEPSAGATLAVPDVIGLVTDEPLAGTFDFVREGTEHRLAALPGDEDGSLWLVFGDATSGRETYDGGRFLYTEPPADDGTVVADFNLAYNPPCVFSPYATCPLPPDGNRLPIRVEAGERAYEGNTLPT
jgi:uncharacterized protein (DUF1684 family)